MLEKSKIAVAISTGVLLLWGVANANTPQYPAGTALVDDSTISELNPTFIFPYDAAMSGVLVDLTEGVNDTDESVDAVADVTKCGSVNETAFVPLADMNCTAAGCEWIPKLSLKDKASYYINYEKFVAGAVTMDGKDTCTTAQNGEGITFKVDTTVVTPPAPTAPPAQVEITTTDKCNDADADCVVKFKHANNPPASHYRVWIADKNGVQIDEDKLSAKLDADGTGLIRDMNGWFEVSGVTNNDTTTLLNRDATTLSGAAVTCSSDLAGMRTCELTIENNTDSSNDHEVMASMVGGSKVKVWIRAWNAKGYAVWSDSVELTVND